MPPLAPDLDRSLCAYPCASGQGLIPCGQPATCHAPEGSGQSWAYCSTHAALELWALELGLAHLELLDFPSAWERRHHIVKAEALRVALEVC